MVEVGYVIGGIIGGLIIGGIGGFILAGLLASNPRTADDDREQADWLREYQEQRS